MIRDNYLRNSTVTILLVGTETARRKHIDWEIYSSRYDGTVNKKSGILVINLPSIIAHTIKHHTQEKKKGSIQKQQIGLRLTQEVNTNHDIHICLRALSIIFSKMKLGSQ